MRPLTVNLCCALLAFAAFNAAADVVPGDTIAAHSLSGQFIAHEPRGNVTGLGPITVQTNAMGSPAFLLTPRRKLAQTNAPTLTLQPATLVVTAERIKTKLLAELGLRDDWVSRIELFVEPELSSTNMPSLAALRGRRSWRYQLILPKRMPSESLLRGLVSALLVELANRGAGAQSADVPLWLIEGMSAHLQANNLPTLFPQSGLELPGDRVTVEGRTGIYRWFHRRPPLTFQQLSQPDSLSSDDDKAFFRACSQLLVEELLALKDGQACLAKMTLQLGRQPGWRPALLSAFHEQFPNLIDVEKWWGVTCVDFQSSEIGQAASATDAWRRLQQTLDVPVAVRLDAARTPAEARITLQEAVTTWDDTTSQSAVLRAISQLQIEEYRSPADMRAIVQDYLNALGLYLQDRRDLGRKGDSVKNSAGQISVLKRTLARKLDALDAQRDHLRAAVLFSENQRFP